MIKSDFGTIEVNRSEPVVMALKSERMAEVIKAILSGMEDK